MKRVWPIIAVANVPASANWYIDLHGAKQTHPGGTQFDQIVDEDGTILLMNGGVRQPPNIRDGADVRRTVRAKSWRIVTLMM